MILTLAFWIHMAATVVWIGGLFFQAAILPASAAKILSISQQAALMESIRRRFNPLAALSLALLVATGLVQMTANVNYNGLLTIDNTWGLSIVAKHVAIGFMVLVGIVQTWWLQPSLTRAVFLQSVSPTDEHSLQSLLKRNQLLTRVNFSVALLVLLLTSVARTA